jgi:hypothetical protein
MRVPALIALPCSCLCSVVLCCADRLLQLQHGTHVAGTVGGRVYGVAKKVKLVGQTSANRICAQQRSCFVVLYEYSMRHV